jgi:sugar/nucleoside kinase (ribokinase family)
MSNPRVLFLGRTTLDVLYWLDSLPAEDTKAYARHLQAAPGGPALNAAIAHTLLGGKALVVSAVGGGPWAAPICAELERHGLALLDLAAGTAYEAPLCTVLVNAANGSRTIVNPPISTVTLRHLGPTWAAEVPASWGEIPSVVLSDGFFIEETWALLASCENAGAALVLDGGSWKPRTEQLTPLLTAAICGERFTVPGHAANPDAVFAWFAEQGVPYIAITRGAQSILGWDRGRRFEIETAKVEAKDTLGAGDVLHGAFCFHFAQEPDFEGALRKAAAVATRSCQRLGIQAWAQQTAEQPTH